MNCARRSCGHPEGLHQPIDGRPYPGKCWGCDCERYIVKVEAPLREDEPTLDLRREKTKP